MNKWMRFLLFTFMIASLIGSGNIAYGAENQPRPITGDYQKFELPPGSVVIDKQEVDVTGDGKKDTVSLIGKKQQADSPYYEQIFITVADRHNKKYLTIPIQGGYNPQMKFCDFNGDKQNDIYVSVDTGGSGGLVNTYLYTVKNNKAVELPVPNPLQVTGTFQDNYAVKLKIVNIGREFVIPLQDHKQVYDEAGVYKNGKLINPPTITVNPYGLLVPVDVDRDGVCELQGVQRITGIYNADTIGYAISVWRWNNNQWNLAEATIQKTYP